MSRVDKNKTNDGFGCKYGKNCIKFNPNNIEKASKLRRLMMNASEKDFFAWDLIPELFNAFKQEHSKVATIISYDKLSIEWKKHFKDYVIIRVSCNNGNLYEQGYNYFNSLIISNITNYDKMISSDSTFFYNYGDSENFVKEEPVKPVKSYMSKMYAEEVRKKGSTISSVTNRDQLSDPGGGSSRVQSKYIVVRGKTTYDATKFVFDATQFDAVRIKIENGTLTTSCSTKTTKISATQPSATTENLMKIIYGERCKCGKYHINTTAYTVWKAAIKSYYKDGSYIVYRYSAAEEAKNVKHYLVNNKETASETNKSKNENSKGNNSSGSDSSGGTDVNTAPVDTGGTTVSVPDYGDPGMFGGSEDGSTKDLAMYIRGNAQGNSNGGDTTESENPTSSKTNADRSSVSNNDVMGDGSGATYTGVGMDTNSAITGTDSSKNNSKNGNTESTTGSDGATNTSSSINTDRTVTTTADEAKSALENDRGTDVYGNEIDNSSPLEFIPGMPTTKDASVTHKTSIFGIPMFYNPLCDPNGRIFGETTMMDLPLVYIQPGRGVVNNNLDNDLADALKDAYKESGTYNIKTASNMTDLRTLAFEDAFTEYIDYFQNVCSIVYGNMGLGVFKWNEETNTDLGLFAFFKGLFAKDKGKDTTTGAWHNRSLIFFADTATSISDSFSNEYSDGPIVGSANNLGVMVRNIKMMGSQHSNMVFEDVGNGLQTAGDTGNSTNFITATINDIMSKMGTLWNGSQILFPQVWNDSRHDRSYNLSFKFFSPYGNKEVIFQKVYLPVLALMTLALPRMDSISGYAQPFYVRVNAPGLSTN